MKAKNTLHEFCVEKIRQYRDQICEKDVLLSSVGEFFQIDLLQSQCTADIFEVVITIEILLELFFAGEIIGFDSTREEMGRINASPEDNMASKNDIMKLRKKFLKDIEFDYLSVVNTLTASALSIMKYVLAREERRRSSYSEYKGEEIIIESDAAIIADLSMSSILRCIYNLILKREEIKIQIDKHVGSNQNWGNGKTANINDNENEIQTRHEKFNSVTNESDKEDSNCVDENIGDDFKTGNSKIKIVTNNVQGSIKKVENNNESENENKIRIEIEIDNQSQSKQFLKKCLERIKKNKLEEKNIFLSLKGLCLILGGSAVNVRLSGKEIMDRTSHEIFLDIRSVAHERKQNKNLDNKMKNNNNVADNFPNNNDDIENNFYFHQYPFGDIICDLNLQKTKIHTKNNSKNDENFVVISSNNLKLAGKILFQINEIQEKNNSENMKNDSNMKNKREILNSFEIENNRKKKEFELLEREEQVTNTVLSLARIWGFWPVSSLSSCLCAHGFLYEFQKSEILKNGKNNDNNNNPYYYYYSNDKNNYSNNCHDENYYFNNCNNIIIRIIIITIIKLII